MLSSTVIVISSDNWQTRYVRVRRAFTINTADIINVVDNKRYSRDNIIIYNYRYTFTQRVHANNRKHSFNRFVFNVKS